MLFLSGVIVCSLVLPLWAAPVALDKAFVVSRNCLTRQVAQAQRFTAAPGQRTASVAGYEIQESLVLKSSSGVNLAYLFNLDPQGFMVIAPDTEIEPVIAYSLVGSLDFSDLGRDFILALVRGDMRYRLAALPLIEAPVKELKFPRN